MDKKTKAFWDMLGIDISKKHYYHFWTHNGITYFVQSGNTIAELYDYTNTSQDWRLDNCWFYVNSGYTYAINEWREGRKKNGKKYLYKYNKEIEERSECYRQFYRAFYFDFDLTDDTGNHYQGNTLRNKKNALLRDIRKKMPLQPTIVETRNGYHVYLILADDDRFISNNIWNATEKLLVDYMRLNVNQSVDNAVSDGARVLRIPNTYHKKDDSARIQIKVKQVQETKYTWADIFVAFDIASLDARKTQAIKQRPQRTQTNNSTNAINAIKNLDTGYFDFPQIGKMGYEQARLYLREQDILDLLEIQTRKGMAFCSPLRKDNHPSCDSICIVDDKTKKPVSLLHDYKEEKSYNIFEVVQTLSGCDNKTAWRFLCSVYGISVTGNQAQEQAQNVDDDIKANIKAFREIAKHKGCEYLKDALPTYKAILKIWKEQTTQQPQIEPYNLFLLIGREYVKTKAKISAMAISRHINVLYELNIIRHINNEQQNGNKKRVNMCKITNLKDADKQTFIEWTKDLYDKFNGAVWHNVKGKDLKQDKFSFKIFDKK